jgi:UDP-N-acetyl-2-amino-2-deoxyglucuronate dehydrogenase
MGEDIGFAIVGLRRGYQAAKEVVATTGAKLVAVADLDTARAQEVASELGCEWTADYHELLRRDDIQVVGAWTPSGRHGMVALDVLRAGKHAVSTKPMDVSVANCDAMIAEAEKRSLLMAIDFGSRYRPEVRQVRRAVQAGEFGNLLFGDAHMWEYRSQAYYDKGGWRGTWALDGGGSIMNQGVHSVDALLWLMGAVERVEFARYAARTHKIETEDTTQALITFKSGAWGTILMTTSHYPVMSGMVHVAGSRGSAVIDKGKITHWQFLSDEPYQQKEFGTPPSREVVIPAEENAPANWCEDVVSALTRGTRVACDGYGGRRSVLVNQAIYESARTGKSVTLDDWDTKELAHVTPVRSLVAV